MRGSGVLTERSVPGLDPASRRRDELRQSSRPALALPDGFTLFADAFPESEADLHALLGKRRLDLNFQIVGGEEYCAGGSTPPGSANNDNAYKVKKVPAPASCGVPAGTP